MNIVLCSFFCKVKLIHIVENLEKQNKFIQNVLKYFLKWQHGGFVAALGKWTQGQAGFLLDSYITLSMTFGFLSSSEEVTCLSHFGAKKGEKLIRCDLAWMNSQ